VKPNSSNPFLNLTYEPALESLGNDYFDVVAAAEFPQHILRFRNDALLSPLGLDASVVTDEDFIAAFGQFQGSRPFLALRYHGYQFGEYNPFLGDGRGFLYGQVRGADGELYDLGTKGSGTTPYSRGADGRLTLKGGVREVLAAEALHRLGVKTSRCLSLIETGESLWRGDEPSPTRASVMIRLSRSHIRFGTFERLHYLSRSDLIAPLLDRVIACYYPALKDEANSYSLFYAELVQRVAELAAQWMAAGFCHGVLNTDNMSITGESFDYGPYAFINAYDLNFTAAYFDYFRRYSYGNQPATCYWNLEMLQRPLAAVIPIEEMEAALAQFDEYYRAAYHQHMLNKLGFEQIPGSEAKTLVAETLQLLQVSQVGYHHFFETLSQQFASHWSQDPANILSDPPLSLSASSLEILATWRKHYHRCLEQQSVDESSQIGNRLRQHNPRAALLRPEIESVWEPIVSEDNWEPFNCLLNRIAGSNE